MLSRKWARKTAAIEYFVHGTTLGINAMLTRSGARVAFVTTKGFRDIYVLGRTDREPMYDFKYKKPKSLVPRYLCFEVGGAAELQRPRAIAFQPRACG